jgi:hypothetical protein
MSAVRMTLALVPLVIFVAALGPALAGQELGPASPQSAPGKFSVGAGYCYQATRWESGECKADMSDVRQSMWYASIAYGFAPNWEGYFKIGVADLTVKEANGCSNLREVLSFVLDVAGRIETGYEPYFSLGLRGAFYSRPDFALGACLQCNYYFESQVQQCGTVWTFDGYVDYEALAYFKDRYDLTVGLNLDLIGSWGLFYAGVFYNKAASRASGRLEYKVEPPETYTFGTDIEEMGNMGANAGLRIIVTKGWYLTIEGQCKLYRRMAAVSVSLNKALGL